jgi:hypothetical protein
MLFDIIMVSPARGTSKSHNQPVNQSFAGFLFLKGEGVVDGLNYHA